MPHARHMHVHDQKWNNRKRSLQLPSSIHASTKYSLFKDHCFSVIKCNLFIFIIYHIFYIIFIFIFYHLVSGLYIIYKCLNLFYSFLIVIYLIYIDLMRKRCQLINVDVWVGGWV